MPGNHYNMKLSIQWTAAVELGDPPQLRPGPRAALLVHFRLFPFGQPDFPCCSCASGALSVPLQTGSSLLGPL